MSFFSKLCGCFRNPENQRPPDVKSNVPSIIEKPPQSSQDHHPIQNLPTIPATSPDQRGDAMTLPAADRPNDTSLPPSYSQNNRDLELGKFREETDKWKELKQDPESQRQEIHVETSALANSTEKPADSSRDSPLRTSPVPDTFLSQKENEVLQPAADSDQPNDTNLPALPLSNNQEQVELETFRQEIKGHAQSSQHSPLQTSPVLDTCQAIEAPTPAAKQPNDTNLPVLPLSNNREQVELKTFRQEIKGHAQSSQNSPLQTSPILDTCQVIEAPTSAAKQLNRTNLPPLSNNREQVELEMFRQEIDKWKKWKYDHPDRNWIRTLKDSVDENSPLLELLPDTIIPMRGLVKSFICTCKKGADFVLAKEEVFLFMREVDGWLDIVSYAFNGGSEMGSEAWKVLDEIRQLIRAALDWSSKLSLSKRLSAQSQLQVYRTGFAEISVRFGLIFGIRLAKGLDGVNHKLESVAQDVKNIFEIENTNKRLELLRKQLEPRLIQNESYNAQEKNPCDPETRLEVLKEISSWIKDVSEESQCFYWLSGAPGVGKSAITASIAKHCRRLGILGAQFFINRNDATTTDPRTLFPTICWRLCERFPRTVAVIMEEALRAQPTLIDDISEDQASKLFVQAINVAAATDLPRAVVIVIDALDEADTKRLRYLAQIFSKVVVDLPPNAKVFISSRAEDAITKPLNPLRSHKWVKSRYVGAEHSVTDVSRFMKKEIEKILKENEMDWKAWGDDAMKTLSSQASGLFIWAVTALNFVRDEIQHKGKAGFEGLLDELKTEGMNDINMLYLTILQKTCKANAWEYERFHHIIGAIIVRQTSLSIADIAGLLALKERSNSQPVDLVQFVRQYRTVLVNDTRDINNHVVPRVHRSFVDFITSKRAKKFRIDKSASHRELALRCMEQLGGLWEYLTSDETRQTSFPAQLVYASVHWQTHLTRIIEPDRNDDAEEQNAYDIPDVPENDTQSLQANPCSETNRAERERQGQLSLAFSRDGTQLTVANGHDIQIWDAKTGTVTVSLVGHESDVLSVGFSPDGIQLISASRDKTARIWDTQTGRVLHVLRGHTDLVHHATFSHDGRTVATCSADKTLHTWDSTTGQLLKIFEGHTNIVLYCTFSPNDKRIVSRSFIGEIMVWDVNSGNRISTIEHQCRMISFCLCGEHLISRDDDRLKEVKLWDAQSGNWLKHIKPIDAHRPGFVKEWKQKLTNRYINFPPALSEPVDSSTLQVYTLEMETGTVHGIAEHGQDVWMSTIKGASRNLFFVAGATVII